MEDLLFNGISLMALVLGLVEFSKKFGVAGNWLAAEAGILGIGFATAGKIATDGVPQGYAAWFGLAIYGLAAGLSAAGVYDIVKASKVRSFDVGDPTPPPPPPPPGDDGALTNI